MDYFIADTHFGHRNIINFEPEHRAFSSIEEHDEQLVNNWNSVVGKKDNVYLLGDVAFNSKHSIIHRLMGNITIVLGNHDYSKKIHDLLECDRVKVCGIKEYANGLLTHMPVHESQLVSRYKFNIHGHLHSKSLNDPRYISVSCEHVELTPISWKELVHRHSILTK